MTTLVLGVGNSLLADEGAGIYAMHFLKGNYTLPDTEYLDGGTLSFMLTNAIAEATNLIIFDAAELNARPGTVRVFEGIEFDNFLLSGCRSVHEVGFADLMDISRLLDTMPENYALVGVQPGYLGWDDTPGQAVRAATPEAAALAADLIYKWTGKSFTEVVNQ